MLGYVIKDNLRNPFRGEDRSRLIPLRGLSFHRVSDQASYPSMIKALIKQAVSHTINHSQQIHALTDPCQHGMTKYQFFYLSPVRTGNCECTRTEAGN